MKYLRRLGMVWLLFLIPLVVAQTLHDVTIMFIETTTTIINPVLLRYGAIAAFTAIFTVCFMAVRARW